MSETPRTDSVEWHVHTPGLPCSVSVCSSSFARQLERELAEAKKLICDFEREVNAGFKRAECEKQHGQKAVSDVAYVFRLLAATKENNHRQVEAGKLFRFSRS